MSATSSQDGDLVVIGGGVFGLATALEAARRGRSVTLLEQDAIPNPRAASYGPSRSIRSTYADPHYAALARRAQDAWRRVERDTGRALVERSGNMYYTNLDEQPELEVRREGALAGGASIEVFEGAALRRRYPYLQRARRAILERGAAFVRASAAMEALATLAAECGVQTRTGSTVTGVRSTGRGVAVGLASGEIVEGRQAVVAGGGWSPRVLPELAPRLEQRQQGLLRVLDVPAAFDHPTTDQFMCLDSMFFGFPSEPGVGLEIGRHLPGPATGPDFDRSAAPAEFVEGARRYLVDDLGLDPDGYPTIWEACMYNMTPTSDLLIDDVPGRPGVIVVTGGSGHGFKFGPVIGEIAADVLDGIRRPELWFEHFSWDWFATSVPSGRPL